MTRRVAHGTGGSEWVDGGGVRDCAPRSCRLRSARCIVVSCATLHRHGFGGIWADPTAGAAGRSASTPAHARDRYSPSSRSDCRERRDLKPFGSHRAPLRPLGQCQACRRTRRPPWPPPPAPSTSSPPAANSASTSRRALVGAGAPSQARLTVAAPSASSRSPLLRRRRRRPQPGDARLASPRRRVAGDLAGSSRRPPSEITTRTRSPRPPRRWRCGALDGALERRPRLVDRLDLQTVREHSRRRRVARDRKERRSEPRTRRADAVPLEPVEQVAHHHLARSRRDGLRRASIAATRRRRRRRPRPGPHALDLHPRRSRERRHSSASAPTIAVAPSACRRDARRSGSAGAEKEDADIPGPRPSCLATAKATTAASTSGASHSGVVRPITEVSAETSGAATAPPRRSALRAAEGRTTRNVAVGVRLRKRPRAGPRSRRSSRASAGPERKSAGRRGVCKAGSLKAARGSRRRGPDQAALVRPRRVDGDAERARQLGAGRGVDRRALFSPSMAARRRGCPRRPAQVVDGARERHPDRRAVVVASRHLGVGGLRSGCRRRRALEHAEARDATRPSRSRSRVDELGRVSPRPGYRA